MGRTLRGNAVPDIIEIDEPKPRARELLLSDKVGRSLPALAISSLLNSHI